MNSIHAMASSNSTFPKLKNSISSSTRYKPTIVPSNRFGINNKLRQTVSEKQISTDIPDVPDFGVLKKSVSSTLPSKPMFNNAQNLKWKLSSKLSEKFKSQTSNEKDNTNNYFNNINNLPSFLNQQTFSTLSDITLQPQMSKSEDIEAKRLADQPTTFEIPTKPNFGIGEKGASHKGENELSVTQDPQRTERPTTLNTFLPQLTRLMGTTKVMNRNGYPQLQSENIRRNLSIAVTTTRTTMTPVLATTTKETLETDYLDKVYNQLNNAIKTLSEMHNHDSSRHSSIPTNYKNSLNIETHQRDRLNDIGGNKYIESGYERLKNALKQDILSKSMESQFDRSGQVETTEGSPYPNKYNNLIKELFDHDIPRTNNFQSDALQNALLRQISRKTLSGVGIKNPSSFNDWKNQPTGHIFSDRNVPSNLPAKNDALTRTSNSFGVRNNRWKSGSPMKTGVARLKLPPVISSTFSLKPSFDEMQQEEVPSITSLGPVNIPNALRRYGNLNKLATFQNTGTRVADTHVDRIATIEHGRIPIRSEHPDMFYARPENNRIASPVNQKRLASNIFQSNNNRNSGQRVPPTMYPIYNNNNDHIRGFHPDYAYYYGNHPRSSYKRLVASKLTSNGQTKVQNRRILPNRKLLKKIHSKKGQTLTILPPQYIPPPNNNKSVSLNKVNGGNKDVDLKRTLLKKILKDYYLRKGSITSTREKRSVEKMLRPPTAWIKYYSNSTKTKQHNEAIKSVNSNVKPTLYSSYGSSMPDSYYQMMMNYNNETHSEGTGNESSASVIASEEMEDFTSDLIPPLPSPIQDTDIVVPVLQTTSPTVLLSKPEAIKKAEISASQVQEFNVNGIQSLVSQASILGEATVNSLSVSSGMSLNKLLIAAIISLIPTIVIAIPFLAPNITRRNRRRRRYFRAH